MPAGELPLPVQGDATPTSTGSIDDLAAGRLGDEIPPHGTLARIRQKVAADRWAGTGSLAQAEVDAR